MRGVEQVPWLYDLGLAFLEATGLGGWRKWLVGLDGRAARVLDLGCGTGRNLPTLAARATSVIGADPCLDALRRARGREPRALLVRARAEALPFRDGAFDVVASGLVLCSVDDPPAALAEVRRVMTPGATLRLLEHVRSTHRWQARLQDLAQPAWTWFTGGCRPNRETEAAVIAAGFAIEPGTRRARGSMRRMVASTREEEG
jgi:ubiquinone/menaquinone biosynthesis C-methylase UbiE